MHNLCIIGIYRSTLKVKIASFVHALKHLHCAILPIIILGDFNVHLNENASDKNTPCKYLIEEKQYVQLINQVTDYKTQMITYTLISLKE